MVLPDATLGMIGGGQLGRMFTIAARSMGYRVIILDPDANSPAGAIADQHIQSEYHDHAALDMLGDYCAVVTPEFENLPIESLTRLQQHCPVLPAPAIVAMAQDRLHEKAFMDEHEFPTVGFYAIQSNDDLEEAMQDIDEQGILKIARPRYPGHGRHAVSTLDEAVNAFQAMDEQPCILEERIFAEKRLSVILARSMAGEVAVYPVVENSYQRGFLDLSMTPADIPAEIEENAAELASELADELDYCGVLSLELFLTRENELLFNTITPRPHNSGHFTVDACATSQFEQQVRMMCGLPPGDAGLLSPVVMLNLMGDIWKRGEPAWEAVFSEPLARLHLYGKHEARRDRKMGHVNCLADDVDSAIDVAETIRQNLTPA
ncbi:MAG: 5-(carboxyamino)imidazole ribonucleotide synthase [Pseudomonadota bacterium]